LRTLHNYEPENSPYEGVEFDSKFCDTETFIKQFTKSKSPLFKNLNVQSLNAKHNKLNGLVSRLLQSRIPIHVIAMQETWTIKFANLLDLPGFQKVIFKNRSSGRGGGVDSISEVELITKYLIPPLDTLRIKFSNR
jgi:hypothetical protein